jgi:hypothetical protein
MTEVESSNVAAQPAVVSFTVSITRAETGAVETYEMVGQIAPPQPEEQQS